MSLGAVARLAKRAGVVIDGALERPDVVALLEQSGRVLIADGATEEAPAVAVAVETTSPVPAAAADLPGRIRGRRSAAAAARRPRRAARPTPAVGCVISPVRCPPRLC